jgi:hypothetical protein
MKNKYEGINLPLPASVTSFRFKTNKPIVKDGEGTIQVGFYWNPDGSTYTHFQSCVKDYLTQHPVGFYCLVQFVPIEFDSKN